MWLFPELATEEEALASSQASVKASLEESKKAAVALKLLATEVVEADKLAKEAATGAGKGAKNDSVRVKEDELGDLRAKLKDAEVILKEKTQSRSNVKEKIKSKLALASESIKGIKTEVCTTHCTSVLRLSLKICTVCSSY